MCSQGGSSGESTATRARARSVSEGWSAKKRSMRRARAAPRPGTAVHQRRRRGTRSVRPARVVMPAERKAAAARGWSQRSTSSPIRGWGTGIRARLSSARAMMVARFGLRAPARSNSAARSGRCRMCENCATCCRKRPSRPREDSPEPRRVPTNRSTAARESIPSYQARSAASSAAPGRSSLPGGLTVTDRDVFTGASLAARCYWCQNIRSVRRIVRRVPTRAHKPQEPSAPTSPQRPPVPLPRR